ncbi:MAG: hypothetical protein ACO264_01775, partial [Burkholderiaceae bacterium]
MASRTHDEIREQLAQHIAQLIADHGLEPGQARKRALESLSGGQRLPTSAIPDALHIDRALLEHAVQRRKRQFVGLQLRLRSPRSSDLLQGDPRRSVASRTGRSRP